MNLIRSNRRNELANDSISSIFNELFNRSFGTVFNENMSNRPTTNVRDTDEAYFLEVASPGLKKDDFEINIKDNVLTVTVKKEEKNETNDEGYVLREFNYSSFERSFSLTDEIDADKINAEYENGILSIELPKREEAKAKLIGRTIEIK